MSRKNERYYKVHGVGQFGKSGKSNMDVVGSRPNVEFYGIQGEWSKHMRVYFTVDGSLSLG